VHLAGIEVGCKHLKLLLLFLVERKLLTFLFTLLMSSSMQWYETPKALAIDEAMLARWPLRGISS
jgi:hypothetical protein